MKNINRSLPATVRQEDKSEMQDTNVTTTLMRAVARTKGKAEKMMMIYVIGSFKDFGAIKDEQGSTFYDKDGKPMPYKDVSQEIKDLGAHVFVSYKDFLKTIKDKGANAKISRKNIFKIIRNTQSTAKALISDEKTGNYEVPLIHAIRECSGNMADVVIDKAVMNNMEEFLSVSWNTIKLDLESIARLSSGKAAGLYLEAKTTLRTYPTKGKTTHNRSFFEIVIPWCYLRQDMDFGTGNEMMTKGDKGRFYVRKRYCLQVIKKAMDEIQEKTELAFRGDPYFETDLNTITHKEHICLHLVVTTRKSVPDKALESRVVYTNEENPKKVFIKADPEANTTTLIDKKKELIKKVDKELKEIDKKKAEAAASGSDQEAQEQSPKAEETKPESEEQNKPMTNYDKAAIYYLENDVPF
jgi:hypothetical protein